MRKLKLESLQVESFDTTPSGPRVRGTVAGHADVDTGTGGGTGQSFCVICHHSYDFVCEPETYDVKACGDTKYFDCTLGCTQYDSCDYRYCAIENSKGCEVS